jgi:tRNA G18 (ribose-2'-O)-methylase SpoU
MERIERADDPRVEDFRDIREAELVKRRGIFIAEGTEVVRTLVLSSRFAPRAILLAERHIDAMADVIAAASAPVYVVAQEVMNELAGFDIHRGCLASGDRGIEPRVEDLLAGARTVIVLEALANHDNVGAIFRHAAAFAASPVLLDPRTADPLYRKAIRVSMGASLRVPFARATPWPEAIELLRARGFAIWALTPRPDALDLAAWIKRAEAPPQKVALLLGTEGQGLSEGALARATERVRIPIAEGVDSLNVATAAAIALFAIRAREC